MDNFKISITIGDTNKNFIVKQSTIKPEDKFKDKPEDKFKDKPEDKFKDILNDLGLDKVSYSKLIPKSEKVKHNNDNECSVCIHEYKIGEFKRKLMCGHEYHKKCIDKWLKDCITCPICRKEIKTSLED